MGWGGTRHTPLFSLQSGAESWNLKVLRACCLSGRRLTLSSQEVNEKK